MVGISESGDPQVNRESTLVGSHRTIYQHPRKRRFPTGYAGADRSGLWIGPGDVIVLANDSWLGMTSACVDMIDEVALHQGRSVLVFGTDANVDALCHFRIESAVRESSRESRNLRVARDNRVKFALFANTYRQAPIHFNQQVRLTTDQLYAIVEKIAVDKGRVGLIVVTDLDEMNLQSDGGSPDDCYVKAFAALRVLATDLRCPVLILAGTKRFSDVGVVKHGRADLYNFLRTRNSKPVADITLFVTSHDVYRINR